MELRDGFERALTRDLFRGDLDEFDLMELILTPSSMDEIDEMTMPEYLAAGVRLDKMVKARVGASLNEIAGLCALLDEHEQPIAYDVMRHAGSRLRRLGSDELSWGDLLAVVQETPPHESALYRAQNPDEWYWDLHALLLAEIADSGHVANWQRGGGKAKDRPKPIPRPGVEDSTKVFGKGAIPYDEMADWLGGDFASLK